MVKGKSHTNKKTNTNKQDTISLLHHPLHWTPLEMWYLIFPASLWGERALNFLSYASLSSFASFADAVEDIWGRRRMVIIHCLFPFIGGSFEVKKQFIFL